MARFNTIQIDSTYLSSTGAAGGTLCKTNVTGLAAVSLDYRGNIISAADGTPYVQTLTSVRGLPISITVESMPETLLETLTAALNTAISTSASFVVKIDGDTGSFLLSCLPGFPNPIEFPDDFIADIIHDVTLNFVVQSKSLYLPTAAGTYALTGSTVTLTYTPV